MSSEVIGEFLKSEPVNTRGVLLIINLKGIVHPNILIWCLSAYPQGIQDVDDLDQGIQDVDDLVFFSRTQTNIFTQIIAVCQSYNISQWGQNLWE